MKFFISLLVVFMMLGFVATPAMACNHDCGNCPNNGDCDHNHGDDCGERGDCNDGCGDDHDHGDGDNGNGNGGGCQGGSCPI